MQSPARSSASAASDSQFEPRKRRMPTGLSAHGWSSARYRSAPPSFSRWLTVAVPSTGHPDRFTRQAHFSDFETWLASTSAKSREKPKKRSGGGAGSWSHDKHRRGTLASHNRASPRLGARAGSLVARSKRRGEHPWHQSLGVPTRALSAWT